jgi:hypothetical protein
MALQRTRRPSLRSGRSLRSLGSPLNAYLFGASPKLLALTFAAVLNASLLSAAPAVQLVVIAPCLGTHPAAPCYFTTVNPGIPFPIGVFAVDATGTVDQSYTGTIAFSSTDPLASFPSSYTLLPTDHGGRILNNAFTLRTLGQQSIVATDAAGRLASGTLALTVVLNVPTEPIPTLSSAGAVILGVCLVIAGGLLSRSGG